MFFVVINLVWCVKLVLKRDLKILCLMLMIVLYYVFLNSLWMIGLLGENMKYFIVIGVFVMVLGVVLGVFGVYGLKDKIVLNLLLVFNIGVEY